jgi:NAD(P)-dependent dehydrogenase (short-subunit alcohol dehydrogenase family)
MANPILVTGAAGRVGAIGRTVTELLLKHGKAVRAMVRTEDERAQALRDMGAEVVVGDLLDLDSMHKAIAGCETMYFGMSISDAYLAAVRDDERHRVLVTRLHVDEVNLEPVDRRGELRQGVELVLDLAPVVLFLPVARQLLQHLRLHTLRRIGDEFRAGPACRGNATAQVGGAACLVLSSLAMSSPTSASACVPST